MDPLGLEYRRIDADDPAVAGLIARHAAHGDAHYPAESNHHQDGAAMAAEGVTLFAGLRDGIAVAMGGYKVIAPGEGEVKSMHVTGGRRAGRGPGARILEIILDHARDRGLDRMFLETGSREASAAARAALRTGGVFPIARHSAPMWTIR